MSEKLDKLPVSFLLPLLSQAPHHGPVMHIQIYIPRLKASPKADIGKAATQRASCAAGYQPGSGLSSTFHIPLAKALESC